MCILKSQNKFLFNQLSLIVVFHIVHHPKKLIQGILWLSSEMNIFTHALYLGVYHKQHKLLIIPPSPPINMRKWMV